LGIVNRVVPDANLVETTMLLASNLARGPRIALAAMKRNFNVAESGSLAQLLDLEARHQIETGRTKTIRRQRAPLLRSGSRSLLVGQGVFQSLEIGLDAWFASGELVHILPDWSSERYPVYAYHPSRHLPPAKVRAFLDFVQEIAP